MLVAKRTAASNGLCRGIGELTVIYAASRPHSALIQRRELGDDIDIKRRKYKVCGELIVRILLTLSASAPAPRVLQELSVIDDVAKPPSPLFATAQ